MESQWINTNKTAGDIKPKKNDENKSHLCVIFE